MIYLDDGSVVPVDKSELPVTLPKDVDLNAKGNPLDQHPSWKRLSINKLEKMQLEKQIHLIHLLTPRGIF